MEMVSKGTSRARYSKQEEGWNQDSLASKAVSQHAQERCQNYTRQGKEGDEEPYLSATHA